MYLRSSSEILHLQLEIVAVFTSWPLTVTRLVFLKTVAEFVTVETSMLHVQGNISIIEYVLHCFVQMQMTRGMLMKTTKVHFQEMSFFFFV